MVRAATLAAVSVALIGCGAVAHTKTAPLKPHAVLESVAFHQRCPSTDHRIEASPDASTGAVLVPPHPTGALVCRYWGNDPPHPEDSFAGTRSVGNGAALGHMVAELDALRPLFRGTHTCPALGDRLVIIYFHYLHGNDDPVRIRVDCLVPVSNGRLVKEGSGIFGPPSHWSDEALSAAAAKGGVNRLTA